MRYAKRPHPLTYAAAGGLISVGVVSLIARALHTFTSFTLVHPFDWILYITAVVGICGGGPFATWLLVRGYRVQVAELEAENKHLRDYFAKVDELIDAVRAADEQGEKNFVRLGKLLKMAEELRADRNTDADTVRIARLHSISGGGAS